METAFLGLHFHWSVALLHGCAFCWQVKDLKQGIATFYDESSGLWEDMWGDHMHHGVKLNAAAFESSYDN